MNKEQIPPQTIMDIFTRVARIRRFEEEVGRLFAKGQLPGFVHLYIGEEAVASGVCAALNDDDYIISTHRGHGHVIAKGGDFGRMMAELFGKETGYCRGKGGSQHIADFEIGMLGACGIVGGGMPLAVGAALSAVNGGTDQVSVTFFGDGASNEGSFHESMNLASAMQLPVIFVCENNGYGEFTAAERVMNIENIADRAVGYGIEGIVVDGCDPLAMHEVAVRSVEKARKGGGPTLIEAKTHRIGDHSEGENAFLAGQVYRPDAERKQAVERDPFKSLRETIIDRGIASAGELDRIDADIIAQVNQSVDDARAAPEPTSKILFEDTWA